MQLGIYEHYKKKRYQVIGIARYKDTMEDVVVYRALYDSEEFGNNALWVQPKMRFLEEVEIDGKLVPRFRYVGEKSI